MKYTGISLFSGMGGDTLGMENAGVKIIAYSENNRAASETHKLNFPDSELLGNGDITETTEEEFSKYKDIDFIFAGFPCQSFSSAGKRKVNDPRNTMFKYFVDAAKYTNAKVIIGENVKGLQTKKTTDGELYIDVICREFENLGYEVAYKVLACEKHGVPQKRQRLIIVGIKPNSGFKIGFPEESDERVGLQDILEFSMDGAAKLEKSVFDLDSISNNCIIEDIQNEETENDPHPYLLLKISKSDKHYYNSETDKYDYKNHNLDSLFSFGKRNSPISCEIIDNRGPSKTIICTYGHQPRLFVPIRNKVGQFLRMLTIDELKQIQGFPKEFKMSGSKQAQVVQIGNAVPPILAQKIVESITRD